MAVRWKAAWPVILLAVATGLVFGRLCTARFVYWDDPELVWQNSRLVPPSIDKTLKFWRQPYNGLYTPVAYTLWAGVAAADPDLSPVPFHLLNILLHATAVMSAYLILLELGLEVGPAFAGALLFAIHPLQVEPVAWVSGMNNLLAGALGLAALWQYVRYAKAQKRRPRFLIVATLLYALALLSKPTAVVVPLMAAALDLWVVRRPLKRVVPPIVMWLLMAAPIAIIARSVQPASDVNWPPLSERFLIAADALGFYFVKLLAPLKLAIDYERTLWWVLENAWVAWPGLAILLPAVVLMLTRRTAWMRAGLAIVPLALLPVLGLIPFDFQRFSTVADRYMYLPMFGVALWVAMLMQRARGLIPWVAAGLVLTLLAARAVDQTAVWRNSPALAAQEFRFDPDDVTAHRILAEWLVHENLDSDAETQFRAAIAQLELGKGADDGEVRYDYGNLLERQKRYHEAIGQYEHAVVRLRGDAQAMAYNNLGVAYQFSGDKVSAAQQFQAALVIRPGYADAANNLRRLAGVR